MRGIVTGTFDVVGGNYPKDVSIFGVAGLLERMTTAEKQAIHDRKKDQRLGGRFF